MHAIVVRRRAYPGDDKKRLACAAPAGSSPRSGARNSACEDLVAKQARRDARLTADGGELRGVVQRTLSLDQSRN
jgi:hypothetical protein